MFHCIRDIFYKNRTTYLDRKNLWDGYKFGRPYRPINPILMFNSDVSWYMKFCSKHQFCPPTSGCGGSVRKHGFRFLIIFWIRTREEFELGWEHFEQSTEMCIQLKQWVTFHETHGHSNQRPINYLISLTTTKSSKFCIVGFPCEKEACI